MKAELTESRTLLNLHDLTAAFDDELRRPKAAAGPIHESYETLVHDWTDDSGEPGDKYDPELETLFREASPGVELDPELMQEFVDKLVAREPELARFLINDTEGIDTMLLQFPTYLGNPDLTDWLSMMAALGVGLLPSAFRTLGRRASWTRSHVPSCLHSRKYHHTVPQGGRSCGMARHVQPLRRTYTMPLTTSRRSTVRGLPPVLADGSREARTSHCSSVRSLGYGLRFIPPF